MGSILNPLFSSAVVQSYIVIPERNRIMDVADTEPRWMRAVYRRSGNVTGMERETLELMTNTHGHAGFPGGLIKECRLDEGSLLVPCHQQGRYYSSFTSLPCRTPMCSTCYTDGSPGLRLPQQQDRIWTISSRQSVSRKKPDLSDEQVPLGRAWYSR